MAGMVNNAIKWTPKVRPTTREITNNHLLPFGESISCSQRNPSQKSNAINKEAIA